MTIKIILILCFLFITINTSRGNENETKKGRLNKTEEVELYQTIILARTQIIKLESKIVQLKKTLLLNQKKNKKELIALRKEINKLLGDKKNWIAEYEKLKKKKTNKYIITFFAGAEGSHTELDIFLGFEFKPIKGLKLYIKGGGKNDLQNKEIEAYYKLGIGYELGLL